MALWARDASQCLDRRVLKALKVRGVGIGVVCRHERHEFIVADRPANTPS